jgi:hypothetical protein
MWVCHVVSCIDEHEHRQITEIAEIDVTQDYELFYVVWRRDAR